MVTYPVRIQRSKAFGWGKKDGFYLSTLLCALGQRLEVLGLPPQITVGEAIYDLEDEALLDSNASFREQLIAALASRISSVSSSFTDLQGNTLSLTVAPTLNAIRDALLSLRYTRRHLRTVTNKKVILPYSGLDEDSVFAAFQLPFTDSPTERAANWVMNSSSSTRGRVSVGESKEGFIPLVLCYYDGIPEQDLYLSETGTALAISGTYSGRVEVVVGSSNSEEWFLTCSTRTAEGYFIGGAEITVNGEPIPSESVFALDLKQWSKPLTIAVEGDNWMTNGLYVAQASPAPSRGSSSNHSSEECRAWVQRQAIVSFDVDEIVWHAFTCLPTDPPRTPDREGYWRLEESGLVLESPSSSPVTWTSPSSSGTVGASQIGDINVFVIPSVRNNPWKKMTQPPVEWVFGKQPKDLLYECERESPVLPPSTEPCGGGGDESSCTLIVAQSKCGTARLCGISGYRPTGVTLSNSDHTAPWNTGPIRKWRRRQIEGDIIQVPSGSTYDNCDVCGGAFSKQMYSGFFEVNCSGTPINYASERTEYYTTPEEFAIDGDGNYLCSDVFNEATFNPDLVMTNPFISDFPLVDWAPCSDNPFAMTGTFRTLTSAIRDGCACTLDRISGGFKQVGQIISQLLEPVLFESSIDDLPECPRQPCTPPTEPPCQTCSYQTPLPINCHTLGNSVIAFSAPPSTTTPSSTAPIFQRGQTSKLAIGLNGLEVGAEYTLRLLFGRRAQTGLSSFPCHSGASLESEIAVEPIEIVFEAEHHNEVFAWDCSICEVVQWIAAQTGGVGCNNEEIFVPVLEGHLTWLVGCEVSKNACLGVVSPFSSLPSVLSVSLPRGETALTKTTSHPVAVYVGAEVVIRIEGGQWRVIDYLTGVSHFSNCLVGEYSGGVEVSDG